VAGRAAPVLVALVAEIALVRIRVGEVPGPRVVHDRLGDLAEGGHHSVDQQEDEQETHPGRMLAGNSSGGQGKTDRAGCS
jgi:hypothetical protein